MIIHEKDTENVQALSIYKFKIATNVIEYSYVDYDKWRINTAPSDIKEGDSNHYLIIDTLHNDAFIHWAYESAIYLPLFKELKQLYPKIRLHLKAQKQYKRMICEHFKINSDDVVLELSPNNTCIFPLPISSLNKNTICDDYKEQLNAFCKYIRSTVSNASEKTVSILLMPRQTKENYVGNNRRYNIEDISSKVAEFPDTVILNTDNITSLQEQIDLVHSSKNIILTGGSAYFFNGMISNNANMVVLDASHHIGQCNKYVKMKYSDSIVQMRNKVNNVLNSYIFTYDNIKNFLDV